MDKKLQKYAELIVKQGVNLEKGEELAVACPVHCRELGVHIAEEAYKAGAKKVTMFYSDENISKLSMQYCDDETLGVVPDWFVQSRNYIIETKASFVSIISSDPELLSDVNPAKIALTSRTTSKALEKFRESTSSNKTRWCLVAAPSANWSKKIFPNLSEEEAMDKHWEYIHKATRLDTADPLKAWKEHQGALARRSKYLNDAKIKSFHYKNSLGTDFTIEMTDKYHFTGAVEKSYYGKEFTANIPTEEVFSTPHKGTANGILYSSMPLIHQGNIIDKFWFKFENGIVVDYGAEKGLENLKGILDTDEGAKRLGEIALVGYDSPIQNLKTLFYNTLFDENASCHFALGRGFAACIENGMDMTKEQLAAAGVNQSLEHVDFMVGTPDLEITATTHDGKQLPVFRKGDWVI